MLAQSEALGLFFWIRRSGVLHSYSAHSIFFSQSDGCRTILFLLKYTVWVHSTSSQRTEETQRCPPGDGLRGTEMDFPEGRWIEGEDLPLWGHSFGVSVRSQHLPTVNLKFGFVCFGHVLLNPNPPTPICFFMNPVAYSIWLQFWMQMLMSNTNDKINKRDAHTNYIYVCWICVVCSFIFNSFYGS